MFSSDRVPGSKMSSFLNSDGIGNGLKAYDSS